VLHSGGIEFWIAVATLIPTSLRVGRTEGKNGQTSKSTFSQKEGQQTWNLELPTIEDGIADSKKVRMNPLDSVAQIGAPSNITHSNYISR
jgi:hypothetical protein